MVTQDYDDNSAVSKIDELTFCSAIVSKYRLTPKMNPKFTSNLNQVNWRK